MIALRFANGMFEPVWNRDHIDHVQIDVPETLGDRGPRGGFYEDTGAYRDMVVTHLFHVLGFVAMEPPTPLEPALDRRGEPARCSARSRRSTRTTSSAASTPGTATSAGVEPDSQTETFIALRAEIDNWRWAGVPFFLRTGKRMAREPAAADDRLPRAAAADVPRRRQRSSRTTGPTTSPSTSATRAASRLNFLAKVPGPKMRLGAGARWSSPTRTSFGDQGARALRAADLRRDARRPHAVQRPPSGIERLWEASEPVLEDPPPLEFYEPGTWGPEGAFRLIGPRRWHLPSDHV